MSQAPGSDGSNETNANEGKLGIMIPRRYFVKRRPTKYKPNLSRKEEPGVPHVLDPNPASGNNTHNTRVVVAWFWEGPSDRTANKSIQVLLVLIYSKRR